MNQLQAHELENWDVEEEQQRFQITGMDSLNWAFRKLSALKAKETEITKLAKAEKERIEHWEASEKATISNDIQFFESLINEYHAEVLRADPKAKTLSTPYGKSKSRMSKAQPDKADEAAILKYVKENEMDEYIKPTLKWADFKKSLTIAGDKIVDENGQIVPGVTIKPESISYKVEVE